MSLVLFAIVLLAVSGMPGLMASRRAAWPQSVAALVAACGALAGLVAAFGFLFGGPEALAGDVEFSRAWSLFPTPHGEIKFDLLLDGLSAFFLVPVLLVSLAGSIYGLGYWPQREHEANGRKLRLFYGLLPAGMALLLVARNSLVFIFGWEVMAMSAFFLVTTEDDDSDVRAAGWVYLVATHVSTLLLFALFGLLRVANGSFDLVPLPASMSGSGIATAIFFVSLVAFSIKAGLMPAHVWLPGAHAMAPSHVSALMSGVIIKMGIYGMVRSWSLLGAIPGWWGGVVLVLGGVSAVLGIAFAIGQGDLKRLLAYSSIENIGIITIGLGLALIGRASGHPTWIVLGLGGALLHVWNHSLFKSLLFFAAGSVIHATHTRQLDKLGGLAKRMPRTAACALVGFAAVCALPPLNGFVSELLIYLGLFGTVVDGKAGYAAVSFAAPVLAMVGALAVACFVKAAGSAFLGEPRSEHAIHAHEAPPTMIGPMVALVACIFAIGLFPNAFAPVLDRAVASWLPKEVEPLSVAAVAPLTWIMRSSLLLVFSMAVVGAWLAWRLKVSSVGWTGTWDCGYAAPTARMEYTASSFAEMLVNLFGWALQPKVRVIEPQSLFPRSASYESSVPEVVLEMAVLPAAEHLAGWLVWFRWLQSGRIQAYLLYILVVLVLLLFWQ